MAFPRRSCVLALAVVGMMSAAARASIILPLTLTNTPGVPSDTVPYGTVTLDTVEVGPVQAVQFTVTSEVADFFMDKFYFNTSLPGDLRLENSSLTASTPTLNNKKNDFNVSEFGRYDYQFDTDVPATFTLKTYQFTVVAMSGGMDVSCTPEDFVITNASNPGGHMVAAHIKTTNNSTFISGDGSGTPPTPEPASLSVLGIGAALLLRRRRKG